MVSAAARAEKHRYLVSASSGIRAATATAAPVCSPVPVPDTTAQGSLATVACGLSQARSLPRNPSLPVAADNPFTEGAESVPATGRIMQAGIMLAIVLSGVGIDPVSARL